MDERHIQIEQMEFYQQYVKLSDEVWEAVSHWNTFERDTLGKQWVRAIDSVGANRVEGDGRYSKADGLHFFVIARASAREARYWMERALERKLLSQEVGNQWLDALTTVTKRLNSLISYRRSNDLPSSVHETPEFYDPFTPNT